MRNFVTAGREKESPVVTAFLTRKRIKSALAAAINNNFTGNHCVVVCITLSKHAYLKNYCVLLLFTLVFKLQPC